LTSLDPETLLGREDVPVREDPEVVEHQHHFDLYEPIEGMAAVGVTNDDGEVLLLVDDDEGIALLPHGPVEPGEDWAAAATRVVEEQTGVAVEIDGPELVKRKYFSPEGDDDRQTTAFQVFLRASPIDGETATASSEDGGDGNWDVSWFDEVPVDADEADETEDDIVDDIRLFVDCTLGRLRPAESSNRRPITRQSAPQNPQMTDESLRDAPVDDVTTDEPPTDTPSRDGLPTSSAFSVEPTDALIDEPLDVALSGLRPGQRVTVTSRFTESGTRWRCEATFEAGADGVVDLTEQAPVCGDYTGVRPMGLVQFATPVESTAVDDDEADDAYRLHLTAEVEGTRIAEMTVIRRTCSPDVERVEPDPARDGVVGELYLLPDDGPSPGVVALHGSGGEPTVRFAKVLASRGFAALALRYFGDPEPVPDRFAEVPVSYFGRAIDWLQRRDAVAATDVGFLGVSRGTEAAILTAARRHDVGAVVAYAPSAYVWPGRGGEEAELPPSAWTVDGDPLPIVPLPDEEPQHEQTDRGLRPRPMFEALVERASADDLAASALPVEAVDADVLLISGGDDGVWHADEMAETVADRLRTAGTAGAVTHLSYDDFGHHAGVPYRPTTERTVGATDEGPDMVHGGTPEGIADAEAVAWTAVLDTLNGLIDGSANGMGRTTSDCSWTDRR
jgi:nucleolar protein 56